jgi:glucuronokinase
VGDQLRAGPAVKYARGIARARVPGRSALVGNPSDGFGGATIAFVLDELQAVVQAEPALGVELVAEEERVEFADLAELVDAGRAGRYPAGGPTALLMAAVKRFVDRNPELSDRGLRVEVVSSSIPPRVGLAGSGAVVIGALRALGELFGEPVPDRVLPRFARECETEELGMSGGLQDQVVQTYGGLLYMDFDRSNPDGGRWERLDPALLPPVFVAWLAAAGTDSSATHRPAHERFDAGDPEFVKTIGEIGRLATRALTPLTLRDSAGLGILLDENFDLRRRIYDLDPRHVELIETARALGAPANYTGSGGAIVGIFRDEAHLADLRTAFEGLGCELLVRRGL